MPGVRLARSGRGSRETTLAVEPGKWQRHGMQSVRFSRWAERVYGRPGVRRNARWSRQSRDHSRGRTQQMAATQCAISEIFSPDGGCAPGWAFAVARAGRGSPETTVTGETGKWQRHTAQSVKIANHSNRSSPLLVAGKSCLTSPD
jgi:hypothetical protein